MTRYMGPRGAAITSRWDEMMEKEVPTERGALLYEEYRIRWVRILGWYAFGSVFIGLAIMFLYFVVTNLYNPGVDGGMLVALSLLGGGLVLIGIWIMVESIKIMPFRVYEGGVTLISVTLRDGLDGREAFVPARDIEKVTLESVYVPKRGTVYYYEFHRIDGENFSISKSKMDDTRHLLEYVLRCPIEGSNWS